MSAIAFAYRLAPEGVRALVPVLLRRHQLPEGTNQVERAILREGVGVYGAQLAAAIRGASPPLTAENVEVAITSAGTSAPEQTPASQDPADAFYSVYDQGLLREGEATAAVENAVRKIVVTALTTARELDTEAIQRLLDGRGRPKTAPVHTARMRELHVQGLSHKDIAKRVNAEFKEEFTAEAVRDRLKPRAVRRQKKKRG